jgi:hypothetical protein
VSAGRPRFQVKEKLREWFEKNIPEAVPVSSTTLQTIVRKGELKAKQRSEEFNRDLLKGLTELSEGWLEDPEWNQNAKARVSENIANWHGIGAQHGQTEGQHSPEAKAERARRALAEMDDAAQEEETEE